MGYAGEFNQQTRTDAKKMFSGKLQLRGESSFECGAEEQGNLNWL